MRIYLDCCCLNRPFDDRRQDRVRVEAEAVEAIIERIEAGDWDLVASATLLYEISRNPDPRRGVVCLELASKATAFVHARDIGVESVEEVARAGLHLMDAAHISSAIVGGASAFLTVDDQVLRKARVLRSLIPVMSPVEFLLGLREGESP